MGKYIQLELGNDWGYPYLARPGRRLNAAGYASASTQGIKFEAGAPTRIRWPNDGHEESVVLTVIRRSEPGTIHDPMGKSFDEVGFFVDNHGHKGFVPLDRVLVHEDDLP